MSSYIAENQSNADSGSNGVPLATASEANNNGALMPATPRPKKKAMKSMNADNCPVCCMVGGRCAWHRGLRHRKRRYINVELD